MNILVGDKRKGIFEGLTVGGATEPVSTEVLNAGIAGKDLGEDPTLDLIGVGSDIFNELKSLLVFLQQFVVFSSGEK